jgi:type I site-specific restriction endonuclease
MKKKLLCAGIVLLLAALMVAGCGKADKSAAELAVKSATEAIDKAKTEIGKIAPDEVAALETALASAREKLDKGDYKGALTEAQGLVTKVNDVIAAAKAKKDEVVDKVDLTKQWKDLSQGLPKMMSALQSRVDILSKSKKLPGDLTAEKFAEVKSELASAKEDWTKAQESFKSGNLPDAISSAKAVKEKAVKAMETLGMKVPAAAKS